MCRPPDGFTYSPRHLTPLESERLGINYYKHSIPTGLSLDYCCFTAKLCLPIVIVPLRGAPLVLMPILKLTEPLPVPPSSEVMVIQLALLTAVHGHAVPEVTLIVPAPPPDGNDPKDGEIVFKQLPTDLPAWRTL